jgi:hypothetical protein
MTATTQNLTTDREAWLTDAARMLIDDMIAPACARLGGDAAEGLAELGDRYRVACGWPIGSRAGARRGIAGQCFSRSASSAGVSEIFISPKEHDAAAVLSILLHELVHAVDDCRDGHTGRFAAIARAVGFEAPLTEINMTDALQADLADLATLLPAYPHAALDLTGIKKQSTRMIKVECSGCGFLFRTSRKHIEALDGDSCCPACHEIGSLQIDA